MLYAMTETFERKRKNQQFWSPNVSISKLSEYFVTKNGESRENNKISKTCQYIK